jgi:uracil phosphoribosyltransferase
MKTLQVVNLGEKNSLFNQFIAEIRDNRIQKDRMRFRRNLERIGEIFAYEISQHLEYRSSTVESPLGETNIFLPVEQPVVAAVLRAGLPLHQGVINYLDKADNAFISAYRMHHSDNEFEVRVEYSFLPRFK